MTHRIRHPLVSFALIATLALVLQQAWAQSPPQTQSGPPSRTQPMLRLRILAGSIASVSVGSFVLTTREGRSVAIRTTLSTHVMRNQQGSLADIRAGSRVEIVATKKADGALTALFVQDITSLPEAMSPRRDKGWEMETGRVVIVASVAGTPTKGTFMVTSPTGQSASVTLASNARIQRWIPMTVGDLTTGMMVTVQAVVNADKSLTASLVIPGATVK